MTTRVACVHMSLADICFYDYVNKFIRIKRVKCLKMFEFRFARHDGRVAAGEFERLSFFGRLGTKIA